MEFSLFNDETWLRKNSTEPLSITIIGKPGKIVYEMGIYNERNQEDLWLQNLYCNDDEYIFVDDWGINTNPMTYEKTIDFIKEQFSKIDQIQVKNKEDEIKTLNSNIRFTLDILNDKSKLEEYFSKCKNCSQYIYPKIELFCNRCKKIN